MPKTATEFLRFLFEPYTADPALSVEVRTFKPEWAQGGKFGPRLWRPTTEPELIAGLCAGFSKMFDVYFGVLPRISGGGGSESLCYAWFLWIDFDAGEGSREETLAFAKERIAALGIPIPNVLVCSGGGYHAYWRLSEGALLTTDAEREAFRKILVRFAKAVGGSLEAAHACPRATDCARILRLPGTYNLKIEDQPRPVEVARMKDGGEKPLVWWAANLPPEPLPPKRDFGFSAGLSKEFELPWLTPQMESWLVAAVLKGGRHDALVDVATRMRKNDQSEDDTLRIITAKAANSGVDVGSRYQQEHFEEIVRWVFLHVQVDESRPRYYRGVTIGSK